MTKYLEFAMKIGINEETYTKVFNEFKSKADGLDEASQIDVANFQMLKYLKKMQLSPMEIFECFYLGNGGTRENENGRFRVLFFAYNNQIYTAFLNEDKFNELNIFNNGLRKMKIKAGIGNGKFFFNELTEFHVDENSILQNPIEFVKMQLGEYIEKDLNKLFEESRSFVVIKADVLSLDVFTSRAQVILMDNNLNPEKTLMMWNDADKISFTDAAKDLIIMGNTYINKDGVCVLNPIYINVPEEYKAVKTKEIKEEPTNSDVDAFL